MSVLALSPEEESLSEKTSELAALLESVVRSEITLTIPEGESVELPPPILELLRNVVAELNRGNGVVIVPVNKLLTTNQAAEVLNVSRPYLVGLLNEKKIPFEYVGAHRRIRLQDVLAYQETRDKERELALADMVRRSEEAKLPY